MPTLTNDRLRLKIDVARKAGPLDVLRAASAAEGATPRLWHSSDCRLEIGVFLNGVWVTPTGWASLTVQIKAASGGQAPLGDATVLATASTTTFDATADATTWADLSKQVAAVEFTAAQMNFSRSATGHWLVVVATLTSGKIVTLAAGPLEVLEDGYTPGGTPASTNAFTHIYSGQGDPNGLSIPGQAGWVYQDLAAGRLYTYGESTGPWQWLEVVRNETNYGPDQGQIFTNDGGYSGWSHCVSNDDGMVMGWGLSGGLSVFSTTYGGTSADFDRRTLENENEIVYDWSSNIIFEGQGVYITSADFKNRQLRDAGDNLALDWTARDAVAGEGQNTLTLLSWNDTAGATLFGGPANAAPGAPAYAPKLRNLAASSPQDMAPLCAFTTQVFTLATGATATCAVTAGNDILIVLNHTATLAQLTVALPNMLNNLPGGSAGEARITLFARAAVTSLTLSYTGYTFVGAAIGSIAANGTHVLRKSGTTLYHIQ